MSKASEKINKRRVLMAAGSYLIFYNFVPFDHPASSHSGVPIAKAKADNSAEEN